MTGFNNGETLLYAGGYIGAATNFLSAGYSLLVSEYQARILEDQAEYARLVGEYKAKQHERDVRKEIGRQRARAAASGVMPDVGSPLDIQIDTEILGEIDAQLIRSAGSMEALRYRAGAFETRAQGYAAAATAFGRGAGFALDTSYLLRLRKMDQRKSILEREKTIPSKPT